MRSQKASNFTRRVWILQCIYRGLKGILFEKKSITVSSTWKYNLIGNAQDRLYIEKDSQTQRDIK